MKSRSALEWVKAYDHIHQELTSKGFKPKFQTLDNEAYGALKNFSQPMTCNINLFHPTVIDATPLREPFEHSKNTCVAGMSSVDPNFPLHLWDIILPQAEISLNLL
jgi:hypothetical protein